MKVPTVSLQRLWVFSRRVLVNFQRNRGILLAGAVAYYTLLSLVPLFALLLVGLAHVVDRERLVTTLATNLDFLVPGQSRAIIEQVTGFLEHRDVIGVLGAGSLLFFSAMAFSVLESAMATIFHRHFEHRTEGPGRHRHFIVSAILPYVFVTAIGLGLLIVTALSGALEAIGHWSLTLFGRPISLAGLSRTLLVLLRLGGSALMLTALYWFLPPGRVPLRRAAFGALAATLLWELVRHGLTWYFATLSMVNVLYGSLATAVIVLLTLEVAAIILLLGAQVIAELEGQTHAQDVTRA